MKLVFFAFILSALNVQILGQSTPTTTFTPKSQCGIHALQCYTDQQTVMNTKFDALDFNGGCQVYKTIIDCMYNLPDCAADADFLTAKQIVTSGQDGICGVDGTILSCGLDIKTCFSDVQGAINDLLTKNFSAACTMITGAVKCSDQATKSKECPDSVTQRITAAEVLINEDKVLAGCDGPCAQALGKCTANAVTLPTDQSLLNADLKAFCQSAYGVYNCINNITAVPACAQSNLSIDASYLKSVAQNALANVGDICTKDGSTTSCVSDLIQCTDDIRNLAPNLDDATQCKIASEFLECISRLPCTTTLKPLIDNMRSKMETEEVENKCPTVGSCNDRFKKCGMQEQGIQNITSSDAAQICPKANSGLSCFDFVRKDPFCINEQNAFTTEEQNLKRLINIQCGGGSKGLHQSSLLLFVIALAASLKKYL